MSAQQNTTPDVQSDVPMHELTDAESVALFDRMAQDYLCISGDEFLRRWDAGEYSGGRQEPRVETMIMLIPLIRDSR